MMREEKSRPVSTEEAKPAPAAAPAAVESAA
jgi:hypothetical protein